MSLDILSSESCVCPLPGFVSPQSIFPEVFETIICDFLLFIYFVLELMVVHSLLPTFWQFVCVIVDMRVFQTTQYQKQS